VKYDKQPTFDIAYDKTMTEDKARRERIEVFLYDKAGL